MRLKPITHPFWRGFADMLFFMLALALIWPNAAWMVIGAFVLTSLEMGLHAYRYERQVERDKKDP